MFGLQSYIRRGGFYSDDRSRSVQAQLMYVGPRSSVEVALYTHSVVARQVLRGRITYLASRTDLAGRAAKISAGESYCVGFVRAMSEKVESMHVEPKLREALKSEVNKVCGTAKYSPLSRNSSYSALLDGAEAGAKASLHRAAGSAAPTLRIEQ